MQEIAKSGFRFNSCPIIFNKMKNKKGDDWFPMWSDKWIFGSTRIELDPAERGVWVDLMALGNKDEGYIRANESTPYLHTQLSGLLNIPLELLESTISKCIKFNKLKEDPMGIYYIVSRETYELSKRHKRRLDKNRLDKSKSKSKRESPKGDIVSSKEDISVIPIIDKPIKEKKSLFNPDKKFGEYNSLDLLGYFGNKYQKEIGCPYVATFGKDLKIFKELLGNQQPIDLVNAVDRFFRDEDEWVRDKRTVGTFKTRVNTYLIQLREERHNG